MITNGFTYIAVLIFLAAILVWLQKYTKAKFFDFVPPIVLLYLLTMIFCTLGVWDLAETKPAYSALKNNILFAMIFLMLLRCDIRKILKLGPKMLGGFFAASISIGIGFIATYAILHNQLGSEAWKALGRDSPIDLRILILLSSTLSIIKVVILSIFALTSST